MLSINFTRLCHRLFWIILLISLSGCYPILGESRYFKHEIELTANNRHYSFHQYFKCSELAVLSALDGKFHRHWQSLGSGITAADIGDNLVLLYNVSGDCETDSQEFNSDSTPFGRHVVRVLTNKNDPDKLYLLEKSRNDLSILIHHQSVQRVKYFDGDFGPSKDQIDLKEFVREHQHGFQRVTATIIPYERWAISEQSRNYFNQFQSIAIAKIDEAPPVSGRKEDFVRFKFWQERVSNQTSLKNLPKLKEFELIYKVDSFEIPDHPPEAGQVWYATAQIPKNHQTPTSALINYKGVLINVSSLQEIYDPQTRSILVLRSHYLPYPWGGPEEIDLKQLGIKNN